MGSHFAVHDGCRAAQPLAMYHGLVLERLLRSIRENRLIHAGDRVAIAVSGGADSVALLRLLLEARTEIGIVLSVAHFNHKIRGNDAEEDEEFVRDVASRYDLPFHAASADTPDFARRHRLGLEAAARQLRQQFFEDLIRQKKTDRVATAHTLDDQAETVLLRVMRGTGTKGLAGIHPQLRVEGSSIIRPLLAVRRSELRSYLTALAQPWREDATNSDLSFTRNRVRHKLLPVMESEFGAAVVERLGETAEIARAEEEYWQERLSEFPGMLDRLGLEIPALLREPLAVRRRLVRACATELGCTLDFRHVQQILMLAAGSQGRLSLPNGLSVFTERNRLQFSLSPGERQSHPFSYRVTVPGELHISELNCAIRLRLVKGAEALSRYADGQRLRPDLVGTELVIRNWQAGDRFWPLHSKSGKKVKELLTPTRVDAAQRPSWPVAEHRGELVWVRGFPVSRKFYAGDGDSAVVIEEVAALG